jgi:hypothetical protein
MGLHQIKMFLHSKGNSHLTEETALREIFASYTSD